MDRLSTGEKIAGASALLLFIFMFFDWFSVSVSGGAGEFAITVSESGNAWDALDNIPIFLLIVIVFTVGVVGLRLADAALETAVPLSAVVVILGAISMLLILYRIIDPPGGDVPVDVDISPTLGIFLSLVAAGGITYGGYRAMEEEGVSFADTADRLSGGPGGPGGDPPPPPPPSSPPPPPSG
jgi:purine-cytosine permease-like protein